MTKPISAVLCQPAYRAHLLRVAAARLARRPYPAALCGARPSRTSKGWQRSATLPPCPRCAAAAGHAAGFRASKETAVSNVSPKPAAEPTTVVPRIVHDKSGDLYESRVLAAMERTTATGGSALTAAQVGRDAGGGWIILGTDGHRALLRKGASETKTAHKITEAGSPRAGIDLTPELEGALRAVWKTVDRKRPTVWLTI